MNSFPLVDAEISVTGLPPIKIKEGYGLCGGMAWAVRDLAEPQPPAMVARATFELSNPALPDHETLANPFGHGVRGGW